MDELLDKVWLDNTLRSYLVVAIIILVVVIIKKYIAQYIAGLIFHFVKAVWQDVDKKSFISLVAKPLGLFLAIFISIISLYKLRFPTLFDVDIYRITVKELLHIIASLVLIISFIRLLLRIIDFVAIILHIKANRSQDVSDNQLIVFFKDFFKVIIGIIGLLMIVKFTFGYKISNLLTGLSLVTNAAITAADNVLSAFGKLQKQITDLIATVATKSDTATTVTKDTATGAANLPSGTTAQRPANGAGKFRFNSTLGRFEGNNGTIWGSVGGATGGGPDAIFYEGDITMTTDYTVTTNRNAMAPGPLTIAPGATLTIPAGSTVTIV